MDKKEALDKLWIAQVQAISQICPTEFTNCRTAARMLRYTMKLDDMATEQLSTDGSNKNWLAIKVSAKSLLDELVGTLPSLLFNIDPELEKMDNVISLSEAIIEATTRLESEILSEQEDEFEITINAAEFVGLI